MPRKPLPPRTHRTGKDPFEKTWSIAKGRLELDPTRTAKDLLDELITDYPGKYDLKQRRTLQRSIFSWRQKQCMLEEKHPKLTLDATTSMNLFTDLAKLAAQA